MPKIVPKPVFQIFALGVLLWCAVLTAYWRFTSTELYHWLCGLGARALALALPLLVNLLGLLFFGSLKIS